MGKSFSHARLHPAGRAGAVDERAAIPGWVWGLSQGRHEPLDRLIPTVSDELRRIAHGRLRHEHAGHTLSTTALVHEAYFKLVDVRRMEWRDRAHFFAMAARLMRRILIDYARGKRREKRGGDAVQVQLTDAFDVPGPVAADDLVALDEALARLEAQSERQCRVVECRCFAGLSLEETAQTLGISVATVKRDWDFSRAWLNRELKTS